MFKETKNKEKVEISGLGSKQYVKLMKGKFIV